jgi:hypothetical protein
MSTVAELRGEIDVNVDRFISNLRLGKGEFDAFAGGIESSATRAGSTVSQSMSQLSAATQQAIAYGPQLSQAFTSSFQNLSAQTESAVGRAAAAMRSLGAEGVNSVQVLSGAQVQLQAALTNVQGALREESALLAKLSNDLTSGAAVSKHFASELARTEIVVSSLTAEEAALRAALTQTSGALTQQASAAAANAAGIDKKKQSVQGVAEKMSVWSGMLNTTTSQISTQNTILTGYDAILQAVVRSAGGIAVVWAAAISIGLQLLNVVIDMAGKKKEAVDITDALATSDANLAAAMGRMAEAAGLAGDKVREQAGALSTLAEVDIVAMFANLNQSLEQYAKSSAQVTSETNLMSAAQKAADEALQGVRAGYDALSDSYFANLSIANGLRDSIVSETATREKQNATIDKSVAALVALVRNGQLTEAGMLNLAKATLGSGAAFNEFQARINNATSAVAAFNNAVASMKMPGLDVRATTEGIAKSTQELNRSIGELRAGEKSYADTLIASRPALQQHKKALQEQIAARATERGVVLTAAQTQAEYNRVIRESPTALNGALVSLEKLDKNMGAFSESTKKAGGGARALHGTLNEFRAGDIGLNKALELINNNLANLDKLLLPVTAKIRDGFRQLKEAVKVAADEIEKFLQGRGLKIKVRPEDLISEKDILVPLGKTVEASKAAANAVNRIHIENLKDTENFVKISANMWKQFTAQEKAAVGGLQKIVVPKIDDTSLKLFNGALYALTGRIEYTTTLLPDLGSAVEAVNKQMQDAAGATADFAKRLSEGFADAFKDLAKDAPLPMVQYTKDLIAMGKAMAEMVESLHDNIRRDLGEGIGGVVSDLTKVFKLNATDVANWASDVSGIIGLMPGKFGDMARDIYNTIDQWTAWANAILGILSKLNSDIPNSVSSIVSKVINIFKSATPAGGGSLLGGLIGGAGNAAGGALAGAAGSWLGGIFGSGAGAAAAGVAGKAGSAAAAAAMGGTAAAGGAAGGLGWLGALGGPWGMAAMAGIALAPQIIGGIKKLFGIQTEKEKLERQLLKDQVKISGQNVLQSVEETKQSLIATTDKARVLLQGIAEHTEIPKEAFDTFFRDLRRLMDRFVDLTDRWKTESLEKSKALAEAIGPVVDSIGSAVGALASLHDYRGVAESIINDFVTDLGRAVNAFGAMADSIENGLQKRAMKFADRVKSVVEVIASGVDGFKSLLSFQRVPKAAIDAFAANVADAVTAMAAMTAMVDAGMSKQAERFAAKASSVVGLIASGVEGFAGLASFQKVSSAVLRDFFEAVSDAAYLLGQAASVLGEDALNAAAAFAEKTQGLFSVISAGVQAFAALNNPIVVAESAFNSFVQNFQNLLHYFDAFGSTASASADKIARSAGLFEDINKLFSGIAATAQASVVISDFRPIAGSSVQAILTNVIQLVDAIMAMTGQVEKGLANALRFQDMAKKMADAVIAGMSSVSQAARAISSAEAGSISPQSLGGISPQALSSRSAAGNSVVENHYHVTAVVDMERVGTVARTVEWVQQFSSRNSPQRISYQQS